MLLIALAGAVGFGADAIRVAESQSELLSLVGTLLGLLVTVAISAQMAFQQWNDAAAALSADADAQASFDPDAGQAKEQQ
jgi:hypothetical protein